MNTPTAPTREQIIAWWAQPTGITDRDTSERQAMDAAMREQFQALMHEGAWFETGQGGFRLGVLRRHDVQAVAGEVALALPHIIPFAHQAARDLGLVRVIQIREHTLGENGLYWLMADTRGRYHVVSSHSWLPCHSFDMLVGAIADIQERHWAIDYDEESTAEEED